MSNPKRPCGHTKIADCQLCIEALLNALEWSLKNDGNGSGGPKKVGSVMQELVDRYEAAQ